MEKSLCLCSVVSVFVKLVYQDAVYVLLRFPECAKVFWKLTLVSMTLLIYTFGKVSCLYHGAAAEPDLLNQHAKSIGSLSVVQ